MVRPRACGPNQYFWSVLAPTTESAYKTGPLLVFDNHVLSRLPCGMAPFYILYLQLSLSHSRRFRQRVTFVTRNFRSPSRLPHTLRWSGHTMSPTVVGPSRYRLPCLRYPSLVRSKQDLRLPGTSIALKCSIFEVNGSFSCSLLKSPF